MNTMRKIVWGPVYITWDFSAFVATNHAITNTNLFHDTFSGEYTAISINVVSAQEITQL